MAQTLPFSQMNDEEIEKVLAENKIGLTISEAKQVEEILGREPTLTEAVIFGIQCSEHCAYRSTRKYLKTLPTDAPNVILGPVEDSGVVSFAQDGDDRWGLIMSHESHNHPSQIVPYEGAATGIGGVVRDVCCMGGKVIGTLDPLRFGDIKKNQARRIADGVVAGIAGYGNPIGIPVLGGDCYFDEQYNDNCLVNVAAFGLVKESEIIHSYVQDEAADVGYDIIIVGKPTDNSGMGGASFASVELDEADKEANKGAVQEPNPFLKRHLLVSTYDLFKELKETGKLNKVSFKDHGAGGNVCSTVEQVAKLGFGAEVEIDNIHTGMTGLHPSVIACSETQERFAWTCHPDLTQKILNHYNVKWDLPSVAENARASLVGKVKHGNYKLTYKGDVEVDAKAVDLTEGIQYDREVKEPVRSFSEPKVDEKDDYTDTIYELLAGENIASRRPIYENYDKQVRGDTIIEAGMADAGVLAPLLGEKVSDDLKKVGLAFSADANPRYGKINPYLQALNAVVESMRNVAAVGAEPIAITDCLCYGNPEQPEQMWEFVEGVRGVKEGCEGVKLKEHRDSPTPVISGNVSLYNFSKNGAIPPSAIIACAGKIKDHGKAITMQFKNAGSKLYLLGERRDELGGSEFYRSMGELGANVPKPDLAEAQAQIYSMVDAVDAGCVSAAHDISEGGVAVTLAEMALGGRAEGRLGCSVRLEGDLAGYVKLFSETGGYVVEVSDEAKFKEICTANGVKEIVEIGEVVEDPVVEIEGLAKISLDEAKNRWWTGLREKM
ncbi:phosphoribosylformylglycinamidine synthase subunit PurL [Patescibacteria group bacterium]